MAVPFCSAKEDDDIQLEPCLVGEILSMFKILCIHLTLVVVKFSWACSGLGDTQWTMLSGFTPLPKFPLCPPGIWQRVESSPLAPPILKSLQPFASVKLISVHAGSSSSPLQQWLWIKSLLTSGFNQHLVLFIFVIEQKILVSNLLCMTIFTTTLLC